MHTASLPRARRTPCKAAPTNQASFLVQLRYAPFSECLHAFPSSKPILQEIFRRSSAGQCHSSIQVSYMEIYKDEVYDLLVDRETVRHRCCPSRSTPVTPSIRPSSCQSVRMNRAKYSLPTSPRYPLKRSTTSTKYSRELSCAFLRVEPGTQCLFRRANKQRSVGSTNLNSVSSRSHAILTLHVSVTDPVQNLSTCIEYPSSHVLILPQLYLAS